MTRTLWEISDDLRALDELLEEAQGEIQDGAAEEAVETWFAELGEEREQKLDAYGSLIRYREAMAKARKEEADRILALASTDKSIVERLKSRLKEYLGTIKTGDGQLPKLETTRFKFWLQNNGGIVPVELTEDAQAHPSELPEQYRRVTFSPNLDNIRRDLLLVKQWRDEAALWRIDESDEREGSLLTADALELQAAQLEDTLRTIGHLKDRGTNLRIK